MLSRSRMQRLIAGALSASAVLAVGCASLLGDFTLAPDGTGGAGGAGGAVASSSAGGEVAVTSVTSSTAEVAVTSATSVTSVTTSAGGGAPPEVRCGAGSIAEIRDDFSDTEASLKIWGPYNNEHSGVAGVDGELHLLLDGAEGAYAGVYSKEARSLRDCAAQVEVKQVAGSTGLLMTYFVLDAGQARKLQTYVYAGELCFRGYNGTTEPTFAVCPVPYEKDKHRFWRVREQGGKTYFEASPSGQAGTYTTLHDIPTPSYVGALYVELGAGQDKITPAPLEAIFDNFNVSPL